MLPKLQSNPGAYSSEFVVLPENVPVPSAGIDWSQYGRGNFPYTFRQQPGPKNALGRVKFMLPNKFAIYLHDTPSRSLFSRNERVGHQV